MGGDLPEPIAFQAELRAGRLPYLFGDAYGQDTRGIDFATVPFDQVFTIDARGEWVAFDPAALMPPGPLLDLHIHANPAPTAVQRLVETYDNRGVQGAETLTVCECRHISTNAGLYSRPILRSTHGGEGEGGRR